MANAIQLISKRAKVLQKKSPRKQWKALIKEASAEYREGKLGAVKKYRQTGTSVKKRDVLRKAKKPGKRKSKSGRTYFERRKNRSDMPGKLTGTGTYSNYLMLSRIKSNTVQINEAGRTITRLHTAMKATKDKGQKRLIKNAVKTQKEIIRNLKHDNSMAKRLIK